MKKSCDELKAKNADAHKQHDEEKIAAYYCAEVTTRMADLRNAVDELELICDYEMWPLPKYWEMLFVF